MPTSHCEECACSKCILYAYTHLPQSYLEVYASRHGITTEKAKDRISAERKAKEQEWGELGAKQKSLAAEKAKKQYKQSWEFGHKCNHKKAQEHGDTECRLFEIEATKTTLTMKGNKFVIADLLDDLGMGKRVDTKEEF